MWRVDSVQEKKETR